MRRRSSKSTASPRVLMMLAALTLALFAGGEALILSRTDEGRLMAARYLHIGDPARVTLLVGRQIRHGLMLASVSADSIHDQPDEGSPAPVRWRVGIPRSGSLLQTNYALTQWVTSQGISVISGREHPGTGGGL